MLFGPAYGLAGATGTSDANLPIRFTLPATLPASTLGSGVLQMTFTQAQLNQLAASGNGADVLAALRKYTYVEIGGQKLLIDQIPGHEEWRVLGIAGLRHVLITLKTPYVGISASTNGHVSLNVVLGGGGGEYGGENYADKVRPRGPGCRPTERVRTRRLATATSRMRSSRRSTPTTPPIPRPRSRPAGSLYDLLTNTALGKAGSVIQRSVTSNTIALAGAALGWQIPATVSSVQEYVAWLNDPANGLVGSEIKLTIDGVEVTRRIQSFDLKRADGSVSMGIYHPDNYLSLVLDDTVTLKHYYVRDGSDAVVAQQLPSELTFGLTGLGRATTRARSPMRSGAAWARPRSCRARSRWTAARPGAGGAIRTSPSTSTPRRQRAARPGGNGYVSLGSGCWDLSASNLSDAARIQMLNAIKSLLASGQNISLTGLDLFADQRRHDAHGPSAGRLRQRQAQDRIRGGRVRQSADGPEPGQRLAQGPDRVRRRCLRRGIAAQALYAYRNLDTNDRTGARSRSIWAAWWSTRASGWSIPVSRSIAGRQGRGLADAGRQRRADARPARELSFAGSSQTLVCYIKSVNGRVVTLADGGQRLPAQWRGADAGADPEGRGRHARRHLGQAAGRLGQRRVPTDDVITLTKTDIVPVLDAAGNVTGYRNLQNYDRVYLNDALARMARPSACRTTWPTTCWSRRQPRSPVRVQGTGHAVPAVRAAQADAGRAGPD